MQFSEKLFKLRKEKGFSQEALAERLNTTRQAVSKWENGQGFPETEKLLMIGNIFEVSIDYLLKDTQEACANDEKGYYVSQEMAEGFLALEHRSAKYVGAGLGLLILSTLPYLIFKHSPPVYLLLTIIIATLGLGILVAGELADDGRYKVIKQETLLFDPAYLKELTTRYTSIQSKYKLLIITGFCGLIIGFIPILLTKRELIASDIVSAYYPLCVFFIALGTYLLIRTLSLLEAYEVLVKNEEYTNRVGVKLFKKLNQKLKQF